MRKTSHLKFDGGNGAVETEGAIELSEFETHKLELLPQQIGIMNARSTIDAGRTGHLKLNKISQVLPSLPIDNQTQIARFKTTMSGKTFLITISVAPRNIATKFDGGLKLSQDLGANCEREVAGDELLRASGAGEISSAESEEIEDADDTILSLPHRLLVQSKRQERKRVF